MSRPRQQTDLCSGKMTISGADSNGCAKQIHCSVETMCVQIDDSFSAIRRTAVGGREAEAVLRDGDQVPEEGDGAPLDDAIPRGLAAALGALQGEAARVG